VPSPVGVLGACPQKKNQFCAKNYAILSKFWYFFPILQDKVGGGLSPSPKSGGTYPVPPASTPMVKPSNCFRHLEKLVLYLPFLNTRLSSLML